MKSLLRLFVLLTTPVLFAQPRIELRQVVGGLNRPVALTHAGDSRLFIVEQEGQIFIYNGTSVIGPAFLDIRPLVSCCGEQGLLGLAFHPRYRENGFFYVNYTDGRGDTVIARYSVSANNPDRADPNSRVVLLEVDQPFANHNGGDLSFGPDGYLYIPLGDGGAGGDPDERAQDLRELLGKILRIDVDTRTPPREYGIPPSNPFVSNPNARPEIWAYGLRNPWRAKFDRVTGDLWIGDVGQNILEEINFQPASSRGGENYGWDRMEGTRCFEPSSGCNDGSLVLPVLEYPHGAGDCSVTGGYRYRGGQYPAMQGIYFYGDFCTGNLWGATQRADGRFVAQLIADTPINISSFGEDMNGELYVVGLGGTIHQIVDTSPFPQRRRPVRK